MNPSYAHPIASQATESERAGFIRRTYGHLAGAVLAFGCIEMLLLQIPGVEQLVGSMLNAWFVVVLLMMGAGYVAQMWAQSETSQEMQYAGLGLYVLVEALICLPLIYIVKNVLHAEHLIGTAAILTGAVFLGLTLTVFITKNDYSNLRPILSIGCFIALGLILCACLFGLNLGTWFCFAMVALASGFILYDTSNVLHHYRTDQHVGAALQLFASVVTLFYYILMILARSRD